MAVPTIASGALRKMIEYASEFGLEGAALLAELGVDPSVVEDRDARIPIATMHAAWEAVVARVPRADGAVVSAERYVPGDYGLVGFVVMTSSTIEEALDHFIRYIGLWTDEPAFSREDATIHLTYRHPFPDGPGKRISTEASFTEVVQGARVLARTRIVPRRVRYMHPAPQDTSAHAAFFGCEVTFGAPIDALEFRPEDLALALPRADAQLGEFLRGVANQALASRDPGEITAVERARAIIAEELVRGVPSIDLVARRMATSTRTLRRRLEERDTSFSALLDATRAELARSYVRDPRMTLSEVAFLLGFSEPSTFHRAFKRWTKLTPAAWRAAKH